MKTFSYPPGPKSRFFGFGIYLASQRDPLGFMERAAREYGDIVHFKLGRRHVFLLNHPDYIKDVLVSHYDNFLKGNAINRERDFLGKGGLLMSEGSFHHRQRQLTLPAFHHERFAGYGATMVKVATDISQSWRTGDRLDVLESMREITLPITSQTLFGVEVEAEHERIIAAFRDGLRGFKSFRPLVTRLSDRFSFAHRRRMKQARVTFETLISQIIEERRRVEEDRGDLLSLLLSRAGTEDERFTNDRQILDEAVTLFVGGFENVATTLTWTWYILAWYPEVQEKLHRELHNVLGGRLPTAADVPRLNYTRMVFEEVMRVYPPFPRMVRTALRNYHVGAYTVPAGALVIVSQYLMHRDSRYYPEPERFDPERWLPEAKRARPAYAYFPFGGGPRRCIGEGFGVMEGVLVLATLASRWRLRLTSRDPVEATATHFLHPKKTLTMTAEKQ